MTTPQSSRTDFPAVVVGLGAMALGPATPQRADHRDMLLDRGLAMDWVETTANWSKLPGVYAAMRAGLDRIMRAGAPRAGAHGLVMAQVSDTVHEGAKPRFTLIYPRMLGSDVAQAEAVHDAALKVLGELTGPGDALEQGLRARIKQTLDPKHILS